MEIAQQLEPYVRSSEVEHIGSTKASAADLLTSSKGHRSRKMQYDATELSSGTQVNSTAPTASTGDNLSDELTEEYKQRLVNNSDCYGIDSILRDMIIYCVYKIFQDV